MRVQLKYAMLEVHYMQYESARCLEQELTFEAARGAFARCGVEFSVEKYRVLGITQQKAIKRVVARLNMFYDCVLIDEFQDFREHDYELIMALAERL